MTGSNVLDGHFYSFLNMFPLFNVRFYYLELFYPPLVEVAAAHRLGSLNLIFCLT